MFTLRFLLIFAVVSLSGALQAQTERGHWLVGGVAGFNNTNLDDFNAAQLELSPNGGYFIRDNLALGLQLEIVSVSGDAEGFRFAFQPFARYYFANAGNTAFFGQGRIGLGSADIDEFFGFFDNSDSFVTWGLGLGADIFFNEHVALEGLLGYDSRKYSDVDNAINNFGLNFGIQVFLGGGK
ncbi:MAG: outer membrane beta-barrel protein [Saprospiraceae bacterium]|nr:outer membrane beta-barrel protein [Saprospiraceae bacterium]